MTSPLHVIEAGTNTTSSAQHTCVREKHSPFPHKASILPANEKHTNIHQSNRKRALESGFDGRGWLEGAVKAQHTRRSRHSGGGVNWRTKKGQKRRVKKFKGFKKKPNRAEEKKQKDLRVADMIRGNVVTGAVLDGRGQEEGEKTYQWKGWYTAGPTWAAVLGKKAHPAIPETLEMHRGRHAFHPLSHTINIFYFFFFRWPPTASWAALLIFVQPVLLPLMPNSSSHGFFPALMNVSFTCPCPCGLRDILA